MGMSFEVKNPSSTKGAHFEGCRPCTGTQKKLIKASIGNLDNQMKGNILWFKF